VRFLIGGLCVIAATDASAQVEFRFAYRFVRPDAVAASFPNDQRFQFMSRQPFIVRKDLLRATTGYADGMSFVEIAISEDAMKKMNALAASNLRLFDRGLLDDTTGLAFVVDGKPVTVIQGVHQQFTEPLITLSLGNFNLSREDALAEAEALAEAIRRGSR
jgi:hypothetical protein